jgi:hypothetical protein
MKQGHSLTILRWVCVLPTVGASFVAAILLSIPFEKSIYALLLRLGLISSGAFGFQFDLDCDGFLAAMFFVLSGALVAPAHRRLVALALFCLGALLTPGYVEGWKIPSYHLYPNTGRLFTFWPIANTYIGGALAVFCVFVATRRPAAQADEFPPGSTTAQPPA